MVNIYKENDHLCGRFSIGKMNTIMIYLSTSQISLENLQSYLFSGCKSAKDVPT